MVLMVILILIVYQCRSGLNNFNNVYKGQLEESSHSFMDNFLNSDRSIMYVYKRGRLGNLMFIFAAGLGLSLKYNRTLRVPYDFWSKGRCFNVEREFLVHNFTQRLQFIKTFAEETPRKYTKSISENIPLVKNKKKPIYIYGFLQSWKYFENANDEIRKFFKERFMTNHRGINFINNLRESTGKIPVTIHVRLRDAAGDKRLRTGTESYFKTAIKIIKNQIYPQKPIFVVLTDDRLKAQEKFGHLFFESNEGVFVPRKISNRCVDMEIMSACNYSIITQGTFGWWGAFLSNGFNIYIENYAVENEHFYNITVPEDFFPEEWIGLRV